MRHKRIGRKLGVTTKHRKSMLRNMVTDLFRNERLRTTDTRAKEIRRVAEKMITLAKEGSLHKRRQAGAYIRDKEVLSKLFEELAAKFKDRPGGYTRITKLGFRKGDNTPISVIELVEEEYKPKKKKKAAPKKKTTPKAKKDASSTKSSKKESAEELGLIEDEEKKAAEAVTEVAEAKLEEAPKEESTEKVNEPVAEETAPEAKAEEETPDAKAEPVEGPPTAEVTEEEQPETPEAASSSDESPVVEEAPEQSPEIEEKKKED